MRSLKRWPQLAIAIRAMCARLVGDGDRSTEATERQIDLMQLESRGERAERRPVPLSWEVLL
jgi:hypothetical protein